eukprot:TRINITY_DN9696_c0_g1_i3.p3 TRINITY_DN9696_c0_g1~~TRINITY_DN9696_c0_g1_i3.p3  ORF type:complete len:149 (+),score=37.47 TRINITY_DN9696_c0_g1_i3:207-653(+)
MQPAAASGSELEWYKDAMRQLHRTTARELEAARRRVQQAQHVARRQGVQLTKELLRAEAQLATHTEPAAESNSQVGSNDEAVLVWVLGQVLGETEWGSLQQSVATGKHAEWVEQFKGRQAVGAVVSEGSRLHQVLALLAESTVSQSVS